MAAGELQIREFDSSRYDQFQFDPTTLAEMCNIIGGIN